MANTGITHLSQLAIQETVSGADKPRDRQLLTVSYVAKANAEVVDSAFFIAQRPWRVAAVREIHSTAGTDAGTLTAEVNKCTGTETPSTGTAVHTANEFNLKATVNTVQVGTLATGSVLELAVGDRLAVDIVGVTTASAGVCISVDLIPV
jgi:hypothetical protein